MDSKSLQAEIEDLERLRNELQNLLDQKMEEFFDQLPSPSESWIKAEMQQRIEENPVQVQKLGAERLGKLKQKINSLISQLPEICNKFKEDKENWPHRKVSKAGEESYFASCFRDVISNLGVLLNEYDLITGKSGTFVAWKKEMNGTYRYQINPGFEGSKIEAVVHYSEIAEDCHRTTIELKKKCAELEKVKARELWDSV